MPTYEYLCAACGVRHEHAESILLHTSNERPCACGGVAQQTFDACPDVLVRGNQKAFKLDDRCVPVGWEHGNSDPDRQEARYDRIIRGTKKRAIANDKQAIKGGIRHIARVPREIARMRSNQFGKDYFDPSSQSNAELKQKLKEDGLLFKN